MKWKIGEKREREIGSEREPRKRQRQQQIERGKKRINQARNDYNCNSGILN